MYSWFICGITLKLIYIFFKIPIIHNSSDKVKVNCWKPAIPKIPQQVRLETAQCSAPRPSPSSQFTPVVSMQSEQWENRLFKHQPKMQSNRRGPAASHIQWSYNYLIFLNFRYSEVLSSCLVFATDQVSSNSIPAAPEKLNHQNCCQMPQKHLQKMIVKICNWLLKMYPFKVQDTKCCTFPVTSNLGKIQED